MLLNRIEYDALNSKQKEIFNFQKISGVLADYGYNCIKLADDWQGADFLAYHKDGTSTLKVQLKSRITVDKKYIDKELFIAFPYRGYWYLIPHNTLIDKIGVHTKWLDTSSWLEKGCYHSISPSFELINSISEFRLG